MITVIRNSIRNKLFAISGLGTALVLAASLFGLWQGWQGIVAYQTLLTEDVANETTLLKLENRFAEQVLSWKNLLLRLDDTRNSAHYREEFLAIDSEIREQLEALQARIDDPEIQDRVERFSNSHRWMSEAYISMLDTLAHGRMTGGMIDEQVAGLANEAFALLQVAVNDLSTRTQATAGNTRQAAETAILVSLAGLAGAIAFAFIVFYALIQRGILRPTRILVNDLERLAAGDFSEPVRQGTTDELGKVAGAAQSLQHQLGRMLHNVSTAIADVATAAEQLATIAEQSGQGVRQQRAGSAEVATAMNEMSATVSEVADNTAAAAQAALEADTTARNGQTVVAASAEAIQQLAAEIADAGRAVHSLEKDSEAIGGVLDVIRTVAEQTNLLALNAAIEAARAGAHGRGFAVVADEVRSLASQTQRSTEEIQDMIERIQSGTRNIVQAIEHSEVRGKEAVEKAQDVDMALKAIHEAVTTIRDMNTHIASATEQQHAVAEEMNRNIVDISRVAEQNEVGATKTVASSERLARLAGELQTEIKAFRLA
ncbi:hypothetical protein CAI21_12750 [Alkalilimnicola ehrlichii]|uniref:Methyl-accepting chemotaxis protein n=1 Tax=Alkalilimnicola ehrlichii TaxID=351052 RepID=A0A3E0X297_9GAMM|nr:methyl-accepting chemotaxis protein [Alkalilimnicola ehrlichii]RFA28427.1 hypothetical protein CAI21_12750 [Alkalilimnicola ehrlichii]RFA38503.1 hypothetical protein CAL65_03900 [Alkalilimnicola ehrlichii]